MLYWINTFVYAHMMTLYFSTGSPINFVPQTRDKKFIICGRITQ